jgi:hypothetical protein
LGKNGFGSYFGWCENLYSVVCPVRMRHIMHIAPQHIMLGIMLGITFIMLIIAGAAKVVWRFLFVMRN